MHKQSFTGILQELFLTVGYSGNLKPAPGTWGSIASWIIWLGLIFGFGVSEQRLTVILSIILIIAYILIFVSERQTQSHDESHIVIDEFVGVGITLLIILTATQNLVFYILGLIFFRLFDIWKPSIIGYVDKKVAGAGGVLLDDILAGICAGWVTIAIYFLYLQLGAI